MLQYSVIFLFLLFTSNIMVLSLILTGLNLMNCSRSPGENKDEDQYLNSAPEIRDVFGDSDDEEQAEDEARNQIEDENVCMRYYYYLCCLFLKFINIY